jgi:uncharacterized protein (TIGR02117 family)
MALLASLLAACALNPINSTVNECDKRDNRAFYIVNHGLHTGIVVKRTDLTALIPELGEDLDTGEFLEIGWGDEKFYQARKVTPALAIQAMFWPTSSVLHVISIPESPRRYFPKNEILEISVPPSGYAELLGYIAETFEYTAENQVIRLGPSLYGKGYFYKATGSFHAFNTCNTWTAGAIETTGYPIDSEGIIRSESLLNRLRQGITIEMKCYSVR